MTQQTLTWGVILGKISMAVLRVFFTPTVVLINMKNTLSRDSRTSVTVPRTFQENSQIQGLFNTQYEP